MDKKSELKEMVSLALLAVILHSLAMGAGSVVLILGAIVLENALPLALVPLLLGYCAHTLWSAYTNTLGYIDEM